MIKVFEMFAGYGGASFGLKKAGIKYECIGFSEIDKYAIHCYLQNHGDIKNYGDCTKIVPDDLPEFDLLTGGFPCQDASMLGLRDLSKGRTNLYSEILRVAKVKKPKYMLLENVKGLLSINKERNLRDIIIRDLNKIGYDVCFKLLNSKDFGIPQNRERVWFVCKFGKWKFGEFVFPNSLDISSKNKFTLKDILLDEKVDKKYYLTEEQINNIYHKNKIMMNKIKNNEQKILIVNPYNNKVSSEEMGTIDTSVGNYNGKTAQLVLKNDISLIYNKLKFNEKEIREYVNISPTLTTKTPDFVIKYIYRRLTPKECFRLMGFVNDEINIDGISDSKLYFLAGNGWDINLVSLIFKRMFKK